ncbi:hypothetical protein [Streptomyces sp. SBT349]|uniref:hypothetical protein n=1 Tax=Streptomyces sp. SBT349 TaxID=1580539 RepID=UPI00066C4CB0|nr:hypothetical protein [Streptomyces sp. SBT349]
MRSAPAGRLSPEAVLTLQRTLGNRAVVGLLRQDRHDHGADLDLDLNDPDDRFERKAEAVDTEARRAPARDVGTPRLTAAPTGGGSTATAPVQRVRKEKAMREKRGGTRESRQEEKDRWKPGGEEAGTPAGNAPASLDQSTVQARMAYVCQLLYASRLSDDAAADMQEWLGDVKKNGLCGGWVRIHQREPLWLEPMWEALVDWQPEGSRDEPAAKDLEELARLLRDGGVGALDEEVKDVVIAVSTAWNVMRELEPQAGYRDVTDLLGDSTAAPKSLGEWEPGSHKEITCKVTEAGKELTSHIIRATQFLQDKGSKEHYARIETPTHHMGVRLVRDKGSREVMVCETEKTGIVPCTSWSEMRTALQNGCDGHEEETIELDITISTRSPTGKRN